MTSSTRLEIMNDATTTAIDKATCGICHRQVSRYTCPHCNVPYCSLSCFRSDSHAQCSESFYRREVESEIRTQPSASQEERLRMMEMLRKFEKGEGADDGVDRNIDEDEEGDGENDLAERLGTIDLDSVSSSEIWELLTPAEREAFLKAVSDPTSSTAKSLLQSADLQGAVVSPWWEVEDTDDDSHKVTTNATDPRNFGKRPSMLQIPKALLSRPAGPDSGPPLLYNICALFAAYSFVTRHLASSPLSSLSDDESGVARQLLRRIVPFVAEKGSTTLFTSMDEVTTDLWARLVETDKTPRESIPLFLRDAAFLLSPKRVTEVSPSVSALDTTTSPNMDLETHPSCNAFLAISDLLAVFQGSGADSSKPKETHTTHKLRFYAAHIATLPSPILTGFSAEVATRARSIEKDLSEFSQHSPGTSVPADISNKDTPRVSITPAPPKKPVIEEL